MKTSEKEWEEIRNRLAKMKITIKINKDKREKLKDALEEVWELKNEHPDIAINVQVFC